MIEKIEANRTRLTTTFLGLLCILMLSSCDPMKHVQISNHTKLDVNIEIYQDTTYHLALGQESKVKFSLKESGDNSDVIFIYGLGAFSKEQLSSFKSMIKEIKIESKGDSCKIEGENLLQYLPRKRQGLFNSKLQIRIESCPQQDI